MPRDQVRLVEDVSFTVRRGRGVRAGGRVRLGQEPDHAGRDGAAASARCGLAAGASCCRGARSPGHGSREMRKLRGKTISMIFQDPMTSLNPVRRVGAQIDEAIRLHNPDWSRTRVRDRSIALMELVGIPNPAWRARQFPGRVLRRHAPAGDDRDRDVQRSRSADRRRADDGAGRDDPGAGDVCAGRGAAPNRARRWC